MKTYHLSKSSFVKGLQCEKQLFLYKHHYELMDEVSELQQAVFDRGNFVGKLAQQLFPGGTDATPKNIRDGAGAAAFTNKLINNDTKVIYEAGFISHGVLVYSDIICSVNGKWKIFEVKSSTGVSETNLWDAAVQYYVLRNAGLKIEDISIVYINNEYVKKGDLDLKKYFIIESVMKDVVKLLPLVESNIIKFLDVIHRPEMPDIDIGEYCNYPYRCSFYNYCWQNIPENSVFDISNLSSAKKFDLYHDGILRIEDIPSDYPLSKNHKIQINAYKSGEGVIEKKLITDFLENFEYPLYFLDFESFQPAVPIYDRSKPYQQIPFQYSLHILETKNSELIHKEFLGDPSIDPRTPFIKSLINHCGTHGSIVVYNKAFEIGRLKEIARDFPNYIDSIEGLIARVVDLMIPFQKKYYYLPGMKGSYSIKNVLPALVPELSYNELEISDGGSASVNFERIMYLDDMFEIEKIKNDLLEYCKLDTFAMVEIYRKIVNVCH